MNKLFLGISVLFMVGSFILNVQFSTAGHRMKLQKEKYADVLNFKGRFLDPGEWTGDTAEKTKLSEAAKYTEKAKKYRQQSNLYMWIALGSYLLYMVITFFFMRKNGGAYVLPFGLTCIALACLHIGLTYPMLEITALERNLDIGALPIKTNVMGFAVDLNIEQVFRGDMVFYYQSKSVLELVQTLFSQKNWVVAISILSFSIIFPLLKLLSTCLVIFADRFKNNSLVNFFVRYAGKWSMADVFVVSVFLAYLAFSNMQVGITTESKVLMGLYFFLAYCLLSIFASHLILRTNKNT
jgi:hypothetical protein